MTEQFSTKGMIRLSAPEAHVAVAKHDFAAKMDYDFARATGDRTDIPKSSGEAISSLLDRRRGDVVRMSRYAARMNAIAAKAVAELDNYAVGTGIQPSIPDDDNGLLDLFFRWANVCGAEGIRSLWKAQSLALRERAIGGECFAILRYSPGRKDLPVPLRVQLLPTEMLPSEVSFLATSTKGMIFDKYGDVQSYHFFKQHPGLKGELLASTRSETFRQSADTVVHTLIRNEVGARRGEPLLTRALTKIHDLHQFLDAELLRKILNANIAYWLEMPDLTEEEKEQLADTYYNPEDQKYYSSEGAEVSAPPSAEVLNAPKAGTVAKVPRGGKITTSAPADSGNSFESFVRQVGMHIAAAVGIPLQFLLGDMSGINDRLYKAVSLQFERSVKTIRRDLNAEFNAPIWNAFVRLAASERGSDGKPLWTPPAGKTVEDFLNPAWTAPPFPNLHRAQEVSSWDDEVESGFATTSDIIRRQGDDPERVRREKLDDLKRDIDAGLEPIPAHWTDTAIKKHLGWDDAEIASYRSLAAPA
ncbi:phage portal protein [Sagittula sp. MA-2]|jgi:lambda family phage portal protein|uniref:phage portal protein n=1 Tax=Sagittula sp. MA-2 TaxID=3048007 RepID=UPI0024C368AC|nr:phage portal protein [Sagittula sp. MA-2]WHZ36497.1 phage portal protein [Sagittula sp. MA-2]